VLLAGDMSALDVADWQAHTAYEDCSLRHESVRLFWQVLSELSDGGRQAVLRFATGVSRPPLLGFKYLQPAFTLRLVPLRTSTNLSGASLSLTARKWWMGSGQGSKLSERPTPTHSGQLPTSATCFNLLKLPAYTSKEQLREKLLSAVGAGGGFELS
jgi:ubiquitin-protein ligase E3 B